MDVVQRLAKALASNQQKVRWRAQKQVKLLLSKKSPNGKNEWTYEQMLGICKGLHYSLWMQDKLLLQEQTVTRLCNILVHIPDHTTIIYYLYAMFETMAREWDKLDYWRVDKFMLLAREFFTKGLQHISHKRPAVLGAFIDAVFSKVLNNNVDHAVGLKMHFCTLIKEELPKKKVKMQSVQLIFKHLLVLLASLPRHNTYSSNVLALVTQITKLVKRRSQCSLSDIMDCLKNILVSEFPYKNSLKGINGCLEKVIASREAKQKNSNNDVPLQSIEPVSETTSSTVPTVHEEENLKTLSKPKCKKKKLKVAKKKKAVSKKRAFTEIDVDSIFAYFSFQSTDASLDDKIEDSVQEFCPKKVKLEINTKCVDKCTVESDVLSCSAESSSDISKPNIAQFISPSISVDMDSSDREKRLLNTPLSSERRVSFGKVFRKKFNAARCISLTPPVSVTPAKGILRSKSKC
ncbi:unnamed protein product [Trichobilharzia szidati]|nr:unnamed protein product [Trichobilharzia szidati]